MSDVAALQEKFGIDGAVWFDEGPGGLTRLTLSAGGSVATMTTHGAHVLRWRDPAGQEVLWLSERSAFAEGEPIRGGVPICFPWFGPRENRSDAPAHGFARRMAWDLEDTWRDGHRAGAVLRLSDSAATRRGWPYEFELRFRVTVGKVLEMALEVRNAGEEPFIITEALHTYLTVSEVRNVRIKGLEGVEYIDKVDGPARKTQPFEPITFTGETDRVYLGTQADCVLEDPDAGRAIVVSKSGSNSTVVWNPWIDKARRMEDFGDNEWPGMVCIETANAHDDAVTVEPGEVKEMAARLAVGQ